ncbi:MAG: hypothetical protein AAGA06_04175 [Pseudomonadota bacterium]
MTEKTASTVESEGVQLSPFMFALVLAPLTIGLPAWGIVWIAALAEVSGGLGLLVFIAIPAVATVLGAPTYLFLGGPAFWFALQRGLSVPLTALSTNFASLPLVAAFFAVQSSQFQIGTMLWLYAILGSVFAPLWGVIFVSLYNRFRKA